MNNRAPVSAPEWQPPQQNIPANFPTGFDPRPEFVPHLNQPQPSVLGTKRPAEDVPSASICHDIPTWLANLDSDPIRGRMKINYSQYNDILIGNGFFELSDLANVSADQLLAVSGGSGMNFGIANRLVTYAKEDFAPLSVKRSRVE